MHNPQTNKQVITNKSQPRHLTTISNKTTNTSQSRQLHDYNKQKHNSQPRHPTTITNKQRHHNLHTPATTKQTPKPTTKDINQRK